MMRLAKQVPTSDMAAVFDRVLDKGIRVGKAISDVRPGSGKWVVFSGAGVELLNIDGTVSRSPLQNRNATRKPRRRGSHSPRRGSS